MSVDTIDLIQMVSDGKHNEFDSAVGDILTTRAGAAIQEFKKSVAASMFAGDEDEETSETEEQDETETEDGNEEDEDA